MLSRNSPTFSGKKLVAPENVTLLLVIDERRLTALIHSFVTAAISKYCFLQQFFLWTQNILPNNIYTSYTQRYFINFFAKLREKRKN